MAVNLKKVSQKPERLSGGHRACAGCGAPIAVRQILGAIDEPVVASCATGCLEVTTTIYPYTAWGVPFIHNAFENSAATMSGVEAAYQSLRRKKRLPVDEKIKFIAFGGDGGTYDIGIQALSGAMERGHDMLYVCYDNGAYMNTGIQRSSATPKGANTTTSPVGTESTGKQQFRKDLSEVMVAHKIPYVAQASIHNYQDLMKKIQKAMAIEGPKFINVLAPCRLGWAFKPELAVDIARMATDANYWPLFEVENGEWKLNYEPRKKVSMRDWMELQGRFKHLFKPENEGLIEEIQAQVDRDWDELVAKCEFSAARKEIAAKDE